MDPEYPESMISVVFFFFFLCCRFVVFDIYQSDFVL